MLCQITLYYIKYDSMKCCQLTQKLHTVNVGGIEVRPIVKMNWPLDTRPTTPPHNDKSSQDPSNHRIKGRPKEKNASRRKVKGAERRKQKDIWKLWTVKKRGSRGKFTHAKGIKGISSAGLDGRGERGKGPAALNRFLPHARHHWTQCWPGREFSPVD